MSLSRDEAIKRTGQMLLSGWKMLGVACPICSSVLLSKDNSMRCPGCNMPVITEDKSEQYSYEPNQSSILTSNSTNTNSDQQNISSSSLFTMKQENIDMLDENKVEIPESFEEMKREYDKTRSTRDLISTKLGEKMLLGWTLLGDICPLPSCKGTPLMKEGSSQVEMLCVSCLKQYVINSYGELEEWKPLESIQSVEIHSDTKTTPSSSSQSSSASTKLIFEYSPENIPILNFSTETDDDRISKLLSVKMLQGWALLDKVCQKCHGSVPLMRDLNKKEHCVNCESKNNQVSSVSESKVRNDSYLKPPTSKTIDNHEEEEEEEERNDENDEDEEDDMEWSDDALAYQEYVKSRLQTTLTKPSNKKSMKNSSYVTTGSQVSSILEKKLLTVAKMLDENDDIKSSIEQVELIAKLSEAIMLTRKV